jgi:hypothetical protein
MVIVEGAWMCYMPIAREPEHLVGAQVKGSVCSEKLSQSINDARWAAPMSSPAYRPFSFRWIPAAINKLMAELMRGGDQCLSVGELNTFCIFHPYQESGRDVHGTRRL